MTNLVAFVGQSDSPYRHWLNKLLSEHGLTCRYYKDMRELRDSVPNRQIAFMVCVPDEQGAADSAARHSSCCGHLQICPLEDSGSNGNPGALHSAAALRASTSCESIHPFDRLTPREMQTLELIAAGWSSKEIARELGIACRTVANHRASIRSKTGFTSIAQLVCAYLQSKQKSSEGAHDN